MEKKMFKPNEKRVCVLRNVGIILVGVVVLSLLAGTIATATWVVNEEGGAGFMRVQDIAVAASGEDITRKTSLKSVAPEEEWNKTFGGSQDDMALSVQQTSDGGYIVAGETCSYGAGHYDVWLVKTDANGTEQWNKTFGGLGIDWAYSVQQTTDSGYIVAGGTTSYGVGSWDFWLVKTDANGIKQWDKTFGGTNNEMASSVQQTTDSGYIIAGYTWSYGAGGSDMWLIKTDANGNEQWNKTFGGTDKENALSIQQTANDGYILAGWTESYSAGSADFWLIKLKGEPELPVHNIDTGKKLFNDSGCNR